LKISIMLRRNGWNLVIAVGQKQEQGENKK
jgi:hypothetical protein